MVPHEAHGSQRPYNTHVTDEKKKTSSGMLRAVMDHARKATDELRCKSIGPYGMRCVRFPGHEKPHLDRDGVEWTD